MPFNRKIVFPRRDGFTLAEVLVALGIAVIILGALTSSYLFLVKSSIGMGNYVDMNMQSRNGLELFGRDARMTSSVREMTPSSFHIWIKTPSGVKDVVYTYDSAAGKLLRNTGGSSEPILTDVRNLSFKYYNLLGVATTNITEAKKVQLDAEMMRNVLYIENTNHVISARFTMRNRAVSN